MTALRGEHGDVGKVTADAISGWLRTRFAQPGKP
jgi:hypothetical protein